MFLSLIAFKTIQYSCCAAWPGFSVFETTQNSFIEIQGDSG